MHTEQSIHWESTECSSKQVAVVAEPPDPISGARAVAAERAPRGRPQTAHVELHRLRELVVALVGVLLVPLLLLQPGAHREQRLGRRTTRRGALEANLNASHKRIIPAATLTINKTRLYCK